MLQRARCPPPHIATQTTGGCAMPGTRVRLLGCQTDQLMASGVDTAAGRMGGTGAEEACQLSGCAAGQVAWVGWDVQQA